MRPGAAATAGGGAWFGWALAFVFALAPLLGWLGPLGFAPVAALGGLLTLHGLRIGEADRPAAIAVLVLVAWAVASLTWSPYQPGDLEGATAVKLVAQAVLYWALFSAAGRASAPTRTTALRILAWGMAGLGAMLAVEALTGAGVYRALRAAIGDPIRPDLAVKNVAQGGFVLAVLAPAAIAAAWRTRAGIWPALLIVAGVAGASLRLDADAPILALGVALAAAAAVYLWPSLAPRVLGALAASFFLAAPWVVLVTRKLGWFQQLEASVPLSWSMRMSYWRHAGDWIGDHPFRGWGIDASRVFGPGIRLHPHDAALQVWLELGLIGAVAAAVFWFAAIAGQARREPDLGGATAVATACAYLTFAAVSFGVWQEWWLALGAVAACACLAVRRQGRPENT